MGKVRNFTLIAGLVVLAFGLLARHIPGITITEFAWGFCVGFSVVMFAAGIGFAVAPVFCKKKPCCDNPDAGSDKK